MQPRTPAGRTPSQAASFLTVRRELEEAQRAAGGDDADVDYLFDIPLRVAQSIVGFKHDEDCSHMNGAPFVVLSLNGGPWHPPTTSSR